MKVLFEWLKDFIELDGSPEEAASDLTGLGFETEVVDWNGEPVLDVEITSNRPDCLSARGIARELSAARGIVMRDVEFELAESGKDASELFEIEVRSEYCPRYCAKLITGLKTGPSPAWMARRIEASGIRAVNNIVDATNYALLATGHPLHAFDLKKISGRKIIVRQAAAGEKIKTLDGVERILDSSMLVIADAEKPIALAGVMGGEETEVGPGTEEILLEGAYFDPGAVRRAAKSLRMETEASYRFQRGADIEDIIPSLRYASSLLAASAGGSPAGGEIDCGRGACEPVEIDLRIHRVNSILGTDAGRDFLKEKFELLGLKSTVEGEGVLRVNVPSFRRDVRREIDLVEEAARHIGYENIPESMPAGEIPEFEISDELVFQAEVRKILSAAGLSEAVNSGLVSFSGAERFGPCMELPDPLSEEQNALRPSLLPGLLENVRTNLNGGARGVWLFELGRIFPDGEEKLSIAGALSGSPPRHWLETRGPYGFFDLKGIVEILLDGIKAGEYLFGGSAGGVFVPGESAVVSAAGECGPAGRIKPGICSEFDIDQPVFAFELDFGCLLKSANFETKFTPLPRFPASFRDAAFVVSEEVKSADIEKIILEAGGELLESFEIFDVYRGDQVSRGKKSIAYSFRYRAGDRTLEEAEVAEAHNRIVSAVEEKIGAVLRRG